MTLANAGLMAAPSAERMMNVFMTFFVEKEEKLKGYRKAQLSLTSDW